MPIVGYGGRSVNFLRLFSARAWQEFDIGVFNDGDYHQAVSRQIETAAHLQGAVPVGHRRRRQGTAPAPRVLSWSPAPSRTSSAGTGATRDLKAPGAFDAFPREVAIQLNDTHPALAVAELMRVLMDDHRVDVGNGLGGDDGDSGLHEPHADVRGVGKAGRCRCSSHVLPRHLNIVYEINRRFLERRRLVSGPATADARFGCL